MKKSVIVFILSLVFLLFSVVTVIIKRQPTKTNIIDNEYVISNFEIDLLDNIEDNQLVLSGEAEYKGKDKIVQAPTIILDINCFYNYLDNEEEFTNSLNERMLLKLDNNKYIGGIIFDLKDNEVVDHSCSYTLESATGSYIKNK